MNLIAFENCGTYFQQQREGLEDLSSFFLSEKQDVISIASAGTKKEEVHFLSKSYSRLSCVNTDGQFDFENAKIRLGPAPLLS